MARRSLLRIAEPRVAGRLCQDRAHRGMTSEPYVMTDRQRDLAKYLETLNIMSAPSVGSISVYAFHVVGVLQSQFLRWNIP